MVSGFRTKFFVLITCLVSFSLTGCGSDPKAEVQQELARIKAEGAPVELKDIQGPKVPDNENGALLLQKAFKMIPDNGKRNDFSDFVYRASTPYKPLDNLADWARLKKICSKYKAVFPLVEQAVEKPKCQFAMDWSKGENTAGIHYCAQTSAINQLICAQAVLEARDGDVTNSVRTLGLAYKLSGLTTKDKSTLMQFLSVTDRVIAADYALRQCLAYHDLSKADAEHLLKDISRAELASLDLVLEVERARGIYAFKKALIYGPDYRGGFADSKKLKPIKPTPSFISRVYTEEAYYLKTMRENINYLKQPYKDIADSSALDRPEDKIKDTVVVKWVYPIFDVLSRSRERVLARLGGGSISVALSAYHKANRKYPARLSEIAGLLGGKMPVDPFSGKPYIYKRQGNGYLLYSVGPNLVDDKGENFLPGTNADMGDIIWSEK